MNSTHTKEHGSDQDFEWMLRPSVSIHAVGKEQFAVRDQSTRSYFRVGPQEACILHSLQRGCHYEQAKANYSDAFSESLEPEDFQDFLRLLAEKNLLSDAHHFVFELPLTRSSDSTNLDDVEEENGNRKGGSVLYYRVPLINPDRFLSWFVRSFPFLWKPWFVAITVFVMIYSLSLILGSTSELITGFKSAFRWETFYIGALAAIAATAIHELGHGATCKRFGGEVVEAGALFMFFMPCLYVNVSDAWIIREKHKRLAITLAGGYCDLCIWAIGVIIWRVTQSDTLINYIAFVLLTTCGTRSLMNFNPLIRLDGYYLLSDLLEYPNLYSRSRGFWVGTLNWLAWGAPKPSAPKMPMFAFVYGMVMWFFAVGFLSVMGWKLLSIARLELGVVGSVGVGCLLFYGIRRVFKGVLGVEFFRMITKRSLRFLAISAIIASTIAGSFWIPFEFSSSGNFEVRPAFDVDLCSPIHSFIANVCVQDGQAVETGDEIVELYAPELIAQIAAKEAELSQSRATLSKLETGPRKEEIQVLERRAQLFQKWKDLGTDELESSLSALAFQLQSLEEKSLQVKLQIELAEMVLIKTEELNKKGAVAGSQLLVEKSQLAVLRSQLAETESLYASKKADGVRLSTSELARRQQQLSDAEAELSLLKLGSRPEEIEAERSRYRKLDEEFNFLKQQREQLVVRSTASGIVSAPRLREKVGQFVPRGSPLCRIDQPGRPHVELFLSEDEASVVKIGQKVRLKARSLPFDTILGIVERISPATARPLDTIAAPQNASARQSLVIHCLVDNSENRLRSGMTGFGRISCGQQSLGTVMLSRIYKYVRTEFWW